MKNILDAITAAGFTKLAYAAIALGSALFGLWFLFWATLGIFIYINFNTIYKYVQQIGGKKEEPVEGEE